MITNGNSNKTANQGTPKKNKTKILLCIAIPVVIAAILALIFL